MIKNNIISATAFAPATCGNVIVGFDILGLAISGVGDEVTLSQRDDNQIIITKITGDVEVPKESDNNIASAVLKRLMQDLNLSVGLDISLNKGIPLGSGMGGSAASAVAALTAFNQFLEKPLSRLELAHYALQGEALCSGQAHADNIVPALFGGITLVTGLNPIKVISLPIPEVICILVHPHLQVLTKEARKVLSNTLPLKTHTQQSAHLAGFISALYRNDLESLKENLQDVVIEPQRAQLIPGFSKVKQAALDAGALGASLSGAGPSMLAFAKNKDQAEKIGMAMQNAFAKQDIMSELYLSPISDKGSYILESK